MSTMRSTSTCSCGRIRRHRGEGEVESHAYPLRAHVYSSPSVSLSRSVADYRPAGSGLQAPCRRRRLKRLLKNAVTHEEAAKAKKAKRRTASTRHSPAPMGRGDWMYSEIAPGVGSRGYARDEKADDDDEDSPALARVCSNHGGRGGDPR